MLDQLLTRRRLAAQFAALSAAAALNPFPVVRPASAAAQGTPVLDPAPPERQVLRWGGATPVTRIGVHRYDGFIARISGELFLPPFLGDGDGNVLPGVCLDYEVSDDGLVYTLVLDPAARFSDGSKITAADIKFTWEYFANPASENPWQYYQTQAVLGHQAVFDGTATEMTGLVVVDAETLQVTLAQPFSPFIPYLTQCLNGIHQRANIESGPDWDRIPPVSSGPYMVETFDEATGELTLAPNPYWWRQTPVIQRLEYRVAPDPNTLAVLWSNDEIDVQELPIDLAAQYVNGPDAAQIVDSLTPILFVLRFRTTVPPMEDPNVRRALLLATDVAGVVPTVFGGAFEPATGLSQPLIPGYIERPPAFDPAAARAALATSTYGGPENLPPVVAGVAPNSPYRLAIEAFLQIWQEVLGIEPAVLPTDPGFDPEQIGANVNVGGPGPLFLDAGGFLTWAFKADNLYFRDWIQTRDDEAEALIVAAEALPLADLAGRSALYAQAEEILLDRAYMVPFAYGTVKTLVKPWVANPTFRPDANPNLAGMYLTER